MFEVIKMLQDLNVFERKIKCTRCNMKMVIIKIKKSDFCTFRCKYCCIKLSIRKNTIFEKSKLKISEILQILIAFCEDMALADVETKFLFGKKTIVK